MPFKCVESNKMDNENVLLCIRGWKNGEGCKNGSSEYKGGRILTLLINVHMSLEEFVSLVCGKLNLDSNSVKF